MCLIAVGPLPDSKILIRASLDNPHGASVAWIDARHGIKYRKQVTVDQLMALPQSVRDYCAVHFRLATAGGLDKALLHPFPLERGVSLRKRGCAGRVLMHNGHVGAWKSIVAQYGKRLPQGPMSDSRMLAYLAWKHGTEILSAFPGQRIVVLAKRKITLYGDWIQEGTRWYSNRSFKPSPVYDFTQWDREAWNHLDGLKFGGNRLTAAQLDSNVTAALQDPANLCSGESGGEYM